MSRKGVLTIGISLLIGAGVGTTLPAVGAGAAHAESVIAGTGLHRYGDQVRAARWGDTGGEQGEVEAPRWGDTSGEQGEVEAPRWGDASGEQGEVEAPRG